MSLVSHDADTPSTYSPNRAGTYLMGLLWKQPDDIQETFLDILALHPLRAPERFKSVESQTNSEPNAFAVGHYASDFQTIRSLNCKEILENDTLGTREDLLSILQEN